MIWNTRCASYRTPHQASRQKKRNTNATASKGHNTEQLQYTRYRKTTQNTNTQKPITQTHSTDTRRRRAHAHTTTHTRIDVLIECTGPERADRRRTSDARVARRGREGAHGLPFTRHDPRATPPPKQVPAAVATATCSTPIATHTTTATPPTNAATKPIAQSADVRRHDREQMRRGHGPPR